MGEGDGEDHGRGGALAAGRSGTARERERRLKAEAAIGGLRSLNTRLKVMVLRYSAAEAAREADPVERSVAEGGSPNNW